MSNMHNHDHDLIAALAEGILADELASAAEAAITACPECAPELAAQRSALQALGALPPAGLTISEAARLRDAIAAALGVADAPAPQAVKRSRRSPWTAIAIAAGLAGLVTIVPMMGLLTPSSDDAGSPTTVAAALESFDDTADPSARDSVAEAPPEDSEMTAAESAVAGAATPTTQAVATTTMAPMLLEGGSDYSGPAADGREAIGYLFEAGPNEQYLAPTEQAERTAIACSAEAEQTFGNAYIYVTTPASLDDGSPVVLYAAADWSALVAFDPADCAEVLRLPEPAAPPPTG
jgi:hypothetical protein